MITDAQLALPLQDARAAAENTGTARQRAESASGASARPAPSRATAADLERVAEPAAAHAERVSPGWRDEALEHVRRYAKAHHTFLIEDVRFAAEADGFPAPPSERAWGAIAIRAKREGVITNDGHGMTKNRGTSNATLVTRWRSLMRPY
jgi:hypothetical protein